MINAGTAVEFELTNVQNRGSAGVATFVVQIETATGVPMAHGTNAANTFVPAPLLDVSVTGDGLTAGFVGDMTVEFTTTNVLPEDGKIIVNFNPGFSFDEGAPMDAIASQFSGEVLSISHVGELLTISRNGTGAAISAGDTFTILVTNVKGTPVAGPTEYDIATATVDGDAIDGVDDFVGQPIVPGALTDVSVTLPNTIAGSAGTIHVDLTLTNPLPFDGKIMLFFSDGFETDADGVNSVALSPFDIPGFFVVSEPNPAEIEVARDALTPIIVSGGSVIDDLSVSNVRIAPFEGSFNVTVQTRTVDDFIIDEIVGVPLVPITRSALSGIVVSVDLEETGDVATITVDFTTDNPIPADGRIVIEFPDVTFPFLFDAGATSTMDSADLETYGGTYS